MGLYHFDQSRHMAEQRGRGKFETTMARGRAPIVSILTSIAWREASKYAERAYRYCLLDMGHAWRALALAARANGCDTFATGSFVDDKVTQLCPPRPGRMADADDQPVRRVHSGREAETDKTVWLGGVANLLSKETIAQPLIDTIHFVTKQTNHQREWWPSLRGANPSWLRRNCVASTGFSNSQLWRGTASKSRAGKAVGGLSGQPS